MSSIVNVSLCVQSFAGVSPSAAVLAGDVQPRGGLQCHPQCVDDSNDHTGWAAVSQLQGGNCQRHTPRADAEPSVGEYWLPTIVHCCC